MKQVKWDFSSYFRNCENRRSYALSDLPQVHYVLWQVYWAPALSLDLAQAELDTQQWTKQKSVLVLKNHALPE